MPAPTPLISVIMVCKNPGVRIRSALESVWRQTDASPELIVIDGASADGTRAWLESQRARLSVLVSEPDAGVYAAMNKGVAAARADWILFLGSDDRFAADNTLSLAASGLMSTTAGVVVGEVRYDDGRIYRLAPRFAPVQRNFVHHQAAFYRRDLFTQHGSFDASLAIMADYDFNLRLWRSGVRFEGKPQTIAHCSSGGLSDAGRWRGYREEITIRHRHLPAWQCWLWDFGSAIRFLRKKRLRTSARRSY